MYALELLKGRGRRTRPILIFFAKAGLYNPPLLVLKSLSPTHSIAGTVDPARSIQRTVHLAEPRRVGEAIQISVRSSMGVRSWGVGRGEAPASWLFVSVVSDCPSADCWA